MTLTTAGTKRMGTTSTDVRWEAVTWAVHGVGLVRADVQGFFWVAPTPGVFLPGVGP